LWECQSCAAWLSWQVGLDIRAAREKVRVARALEQFPVISVGMATGQLSYSKVRAITRIATPECEQALVDMALAGTTNHVERIVSAYRRAEPIAVEREQVQHARRSLRHHIDDDGSVVITVRLAAEAGTAVLSAIEQFVAPSVPEPDGTRIPLSARRADALVDLVEVAHGAAADGGTSPRYLVTMHVAESALHGGDGCCEIDGHGDSIDQPMGISVETALRLACDADIETAVTDEDGDMKHLSRRQRLVRGMLRRKVEERDDHRCQVPGCGRRGRLEVHHIRHSFHGGESKLSNAMLLCRFHHHRLHEGGWTAEVTPDGFEFYAPDGRRISARPVPVAGDRAAVAARQRNAADARCRWTGERLDLDTALTALFSRTHPHSPGSVSTV
jgi:HNH endonuclease